jgi:hypothetical protein
MAVTILTKFYLTTTGGSAVSVPSGTWGTLSKVVFTSPNILSPAVAGTRSHILPGELDLALWYEDTGNMYRKANKQIATATPFASNWSPDFYDEGFCPQNSVLFEVTSGECYDCRFTAWDSITHTTTNKFLLSTGRVRCSAIAYKCSGTRQIPNNVVSVSGTAPSYNTTLSGNGSYYGDFDMVYETATSSGTLGDFVAVKPWLSNIDGTVPYGNHDFVLTLHYSYT